MDALHRQKAFFAPLFPHEAKVCNAPPLPHFFRFITKKPLFLTIYFASQKIRPRFAKPSILARNMLHFARQYDGFWIVISMGISGWVEILAFSNSQSSHKNNEEKLFYLKYNDDFCK